MLRMGTHPFRWPSLADQPLDLPELRQPCCRKCRREAIIQLCLQTLNLLEVENKAKKAINREALKQRLERVIEQLLGQLKILESQCFSQYEQIWVEWKSVLHNQQRESERWVEEDTSSVGRRSTSTSLFSIFPAQFQPDHSRPPSLVPTADGRVSRVKGAPTITSRLRLRPLSSTKQQKSTKCCPNCGVWLHPSKECFCSLRTECAGCTLSRWSALEMKTTSSISSPATTESRPATSANHHHHRRNRNKKGSSRRRSFSLPTCAHTSFSSPLSFSVSGLSLLLKAFLSEFSQNISSQQSHQNLINAFLLNQTHPYCQSDHVSRQSAVFSLLNSLIPHHIRYLPSVHYTIFLHGLYGMAKDYCRFRDFLMLSYPDVHCFVPDCYSGRAMAGVDVITSIISDYFFQEKLFTWSMGRLPTSPDLLRNVSLSHEVHYLSRSKNGHLQQSKIYLSFIGHSLGGILARSLINRKEFNYFSSRKSSPNNSTSCHSLPRIRQRRSSMKNNYYYLESKNLVTNNCVSNRTGIEYMNLVTFASPHNGIFETSGTLQAISHLVPTGRDLITDSPALQKLGHPNSLMSLIKFRQLVLYGNIGNDYLVGPYTSLVINPFHLNQNEKNNNKTKNAAHDNNNNNNMILEDSTLCFPSCVRSLCLKRPTVPIEIDANGYVIDALAQDVTTEKCRPRMELGTIEIEQVCNSMDCVHGRQRASQQSENLMKHQHYDATNNVNSFFNQLQQATKGLQTIIRGTQKSLSSQKKRMFNSIEEDTFKISHKKSDHQFRSSSPTKIQTERENSYQTSCPSLSSDVSDAFNQSQQSPEGQRQTKSLSPKMNRKKIGRKKIHSLPMEEIAAKKNEISRSEANHHLTQVVVATTTTTETVSLLDDSNSIADKFLQNRMVQALSNHKSSENYTSQSPNLPPPRILPKESPFQQISPLHLMNNFWKLPWRRFGVHLPSVVRAHACIIWHGRVDTWNLGEPVVQHFVEKVFVHPFCLQ